MTSFLFPLRLLHHQSVWRNPPRQVVTLILQSCTKKCFHLILAESQVEVWNFFLFFFLLVKKPKPSCFSQAADDSESTAGAGRVILDHDRTDWALFSENCRNISGKCRRPKNLITLHHETDRRKHWTPPRMMFYSRSVRDWIFPLTFSELSMTPDLWLQRHQFQRAHIKSLEFKRVSSGHLINAAIFCWSLSAHSCLKRDLLVLYYTVQSPAAEIDAVSFTQTKCEITTICHTQYLRGRK